MKNVAISLLKVKNEDMQSYLDALTIAKESVKDLEYEITIHYDVMDNKFVPNSGIDINSIDKVVSNGYYVDTHLMVEKPIEENYIDIALEKGSRDVTIHIEVPEFEKCLTYLLDKKEALNGELRVGVAINPYTNVALLKKYMDKIDKVIVMSVVPGFGGQKYIEEVTEKIVKIKEEYPHIFVQVDGGVNKDTFEMPLNAGADSFVVGSYLTDDVEDLKNRLENLNNIIKKA